MRKHAAHWEASLQKHPEYQMRINRGDIFVNPKPHCTHRPKLANPNPQPIDCRRMDLNLKPHTLNTELLYPQNKRSSAFGALVDILACAKTCNHERWMFLNERCNTNVETAGWYQCGSHHSKDEKCCPCFGPYKGHTASSNVLLPFVTCSGCQRRERVRKRQDVC